VAGRRPAAAGLARALLSVLLLALASAGPAAPAGAQLYFGQNLVQYDRLDWRVLETEHFLVHYYPAEREAAVDAARMAERSYARLSRLLRHQFREKKPLLLFASRGDFAQSNVFGDLGEGTGGVTDPLRQRMAEPFTGDYRSFEHVLVHEMVHQFQFDVFSRGKAGANLQRLSRVSPPLWFMEGMAEFLSLGYEHPQTDAWVRDAAVNGGLPSVKEMTQRPDRYFPYRYGFALWQYVGRRWGDQAVADVMNLVPSLGVERAFRRALGVSLEELGDEWREDAQRRHLPEAARMERPRRFAQPLLTQRRTGGAADVYTAPALSPDGRYVAFISYGSYLKGEVFPALYLADARTGKRVRRLVRSATDPNAEELRQLYSQSSFSPDGATLAYTAQRRGRDVLYLLDVRRADATPVRIDLPVEQVLSPAWSPDGRRLVFSGNAGGITDLYVVGRDGAHLRRLTRDRYGDVQPAWSPDGRTVAFASDRRMDLGVLRTAAWTIALCDVETGAVTELPGQAGLNINPQWSPDGRALAYVSERSGAANLFLYDLDARAHYQLTNVLGAVNGFTEYSPAISWARAADVLAFTYYERGTNNVWLVRNPRSLRRAPYAAPAGPPVAAAPDTAPTGAARSAADPLGPVYRAPDATFRAAAELPGAAGARAVRLAALLDSAELGLPDTARFRDGPYRGALQPEYATQPQVGVGSQGNFGQQVYGGTTIVLGDMLGNRQLAVGGGVNGRVSDAQLFVGYTSLGRRLQYTTGASQLPLYFFGTAPTQDSLPDGGLAVTDNVRRFVARDAYWRALYPFDRFRRVEVGARASQIGQSVIPVVTRYDAAGAPVAQDRGARRGAGSATLFAPSLAFVHDNAIFGYTSPIAGQRLRLQIEPQLGTWRWVDALADYRRYQPILFNVLTLSARAFASVTAGRDEAQFPKFVGRPDLLRGYNREPYAGATCTAAGQAVQANCGLQQLFGSRLALVNAELRFPVVRRLDLGLLPITLPPVDGLVFYDAGVAWTGRAAAGQPTQRLTAARPANYDLTAQRYPLRSYGYGVRFNLYGFAVIRWDYAWPLDSPNRRPFGTWFFGPSF
jgi:Tol biopolymer transport system component